MSDIDLRKQIVLLILVGGLFGGALFYAIRCQNSASCKLSPTFWASLNALRPANASELNRRKRDTK